MMKEEALSSTWLMKRSCGETVQTDAKDRERIEKAKELNAGRKKERGTRTRTRKQLYRLWGSRREGQENLEQKSPQHSFQKRPSSSPSSWAVCFVP